MKAATSNSSSMPRLAAPSTKVSNTLNPAIEPSLSGAGRPASSAAPPQVGLEHFAVIDRSQ